MRFKYLACFIAIFSAGITGAFAEESDTRRLAEVQVEAEKLPPLYLPDAVGTSLFAGKKTSVAELEVLPPIPNENYRQIFSQLPGVLVSEVSNESFASLNYRGIGDPHEAFNINLMKDGVSIAADPFGYPAAYYQPPAPTVERVELTRGGSALLYGPRPGAALNFITKKPKFDTPFTFNTSQSLGSFEFFSSYNELSYGTEDSAFLGSYHRRQSEGFRDYNSDYYLNNGIAKAAFEVGMGAKVLLDFDVYQGSFGEAGGLALDPAAGVLDYNTDREQATLRHDRLIIERYAPTLNLDYEISKTARLDLKLFATQLSRFSRRQDLGGAPAFGGIPLAETNTITRQDFTNVGLDARVKQDYDLFNEQHSLTAGLYSFTSYSPQRIEKGSNPWANTGDLNRLVYRTSTDISAFVENQFNVGDLKIVPGFRMENIYYDLNERVDSSATAELRQENRWYNEPLFGLGVGYQLAETHELYGNISESYQPVAFQDIVPLNTGDSISADLDPAKAVNMEVGYRGSVNEIISYDASLFRTEYDNQFGRVGNVIQNVGRALYQGVELATEIAVISGARSLLGYQESPGFGELKLFFNTTFLDAKFTAGPVNEKTPQYAPDYLIRTGATYEFAECLKIALIGTFVDSHFADDGNTTNRYIPSYEVIDLLGEYRVSPQFAFNFGVNNLFDRDYYSRIRSNGIEPALPLNAFVGATLTF